VRRWALLLCFAGCATTPLKTMHTPSRLDAKSLEGTWRVVGTTFPMWLDGKKTEPRFGYSRIETHDDVTTMEDLVSYREGGKPGSIEGVDTQSATVPTHFTWRGHGVLALFASDWDVVFVDTERRFAIITFSKTLATPSGLDVIAREPVGDEVWTEALREVESQPELKALAAGLQKL
jgi:hypothetical protein